MNSLSRWHKPNSWISDPFGYVFLPRAMLEIGKALFPDEWTGNEPYLATCLKLDPAVIVLLRLRPGVPLDWDTVVQARQKFAEDRERQRKDDLAKAKAAGRVVGARRFPPPVRAASAYAEAASSPGVRADVAWKDEAAFDTERQAARRYASVCTKVADALRSGQLVCGTRPRPGGSVRQGQREWWETEGSKLAIRFECFALSRNKPFSIGLRDDAEWICVSRDSLDAFLASFRPSHTSTAKSESDATHHLTERLKQDPDLKRPDAEVECRKKFKISQRGFRDRVWPQARENAGLPPKAPPGRKKQKKELKR